MNLLPLVLSLLLCSSGLPLAAVAQSQPPQPNLSVEGKVLHEPGGEPIRKAVVRLLPAGGDSGVPTSFPTDMGINETEAIQVFTSLGVGEGQGDERLKYVTASDAEGRFKFEKVPAGTYIVSVSRDGYVPTDGKLRDTMITVVEGQNLTDLTYKMTTAGLIAGKIVDADGDPVFGVTVQALPKGQGNSRTIGLLATYLSAAGVASAIPGLATTNDLGEYRIASLRAGQYVLIARPRANMAPPPPPAGRSHSGERLLYAPTYYPGVLDEKQASSLRVVSGNVATADFTLLVHRASHVSGIVSGLANAKGSYIMLLSNTGRQQQQTLDEGGKFAFPSLEPGTYFAQVVEVPEGREAPKTMTVPNPIVVSGSDLTDLVLQPFANGKVSGRFRVEGEDTVDWQQMTITLRHVAEPDENTSEKGLLALMQEGRSANFNEDGSLEISDVPPGNYQVAVAAPADKYRDWYLKSVLFAGREVADTGFAASGETTLDAVVSAKGASIEGKVLDSAGKPAADVFVATLPSSGKLGRPDSYQIAKTDAKGSFLLRGMNPGDFTVVALENFQDDARTAEFCEKYGRQGTTVSLTEGERKTLTLTVIADEGKR